MSGQATSRSTTLMIELLMVGQVPADHVLQRLPIGSVDVGHVSDKLFHD